MRKGTMTVRRELTITPSKTLVRILSLDTVIFLPRIWPRCEVSARMRTSVSSGSSAPWCVGNCKFWCVYQVICKSKASVYIVEMTSIQAVYSSKHQERLSIAVNIDWDLPMSGCRKYKISCLSSTLFSTNSISDLGIYLWTRLQHKESSIQYNRLLRFLMRGL